MPEATHQAAQDWTWTKTANPAEPIFTIFVQTKLISIDILDDSGNVVQPGNKPKREIIASNGSPYVPPTAFKDTAANFNLSHLNSMGVANWQFIGESEMGNGVTAFHFFKNKTLAQINNPWLTQERVGEHYWEPVVLAVWIEVDWSFPQSANIVGEGKNGASGFIIAPTIRIRADELPPISEGTLIITRKFLTAVYPNIPHHKVPIPLPLDIQVNGDRFYREKCLHGVLYIPATPSGSRQWLTTGATSDVGGFIGEQTIEPTNFQRRRAFIKEDDPVQNEYGLWERTQTEVRPPKTKAQESN